MDLERSVAIWIKETEFESGDYQIQMSDSESIHVVINTFKTRWICFP